MQIQHNRVKSPVELEKSEVWLGQYTRMSNIEVVKSGVWHQSKHGQRQIALISFFILSFLVLFFTFRQGLVETNDIFAYFTRNSGHSEASFFTQPKGLVCNILMAHVSCHPNRVKLSGNSQSPRVWLKILNLQAKLLIFSTIASNVLNTADLIS